MHSQNFSQSLKNSSWGPYSQHSILFVTYVSAQEAILFHDTKLERLTSDKQANLLGQFLSYEENEVFWICTMISRDSQAFIEQKILT